MKKFLIIILLAIIDIIVYIAKTIHNFYGENKTKIKKYLCSFHDVLKEELEK